MKYFTKKVGNKTAQVTFYLQEPSDEIDPKRKFPTMVVVPGGAYMWTSDREGEVIALEFLAKGYHAIVVNYSTEGLAAFKDEQNLPVNPVSVFPNPLIELAEAIALIRENAEEWSVDSNRISVVGFSAGGNLTALLGVYWHEAWLEKKVGKSKELYRPNFLGIAYAPVDFVDIHKEESLINLALLGKLKVSVEERKKISPVYHVSKNMPHSFIWHTGEDPLVSPKNALVLALKMQEVGVPFELHLYEKGIHGVALADSRTSRKENQSNKQASTWVSLFLGWLQAQE